MKRAYLILGALTLAAGLALTAAGRIPLRRTPAAPAPVAGAGEVVVLAVAIEGGAIHPASCAVPKDRRVRLTVTNRGAAAASLSLAGYQDRATLGPLAPGEARTVEFLADRPGEDFAWLLDGRPVGRLAVTGSHLAEGHR